MGGIFLFWELVRASPSILLLKTVPLLKKPLGLSLLRYACKRKPYLENFISRPSVIPTFCQRRCTNRGRNFVRSKRRFPLHEQHHLYLFLRLNNSETFVELVGATPLHLLSQTALPLKSPTGAFIATLRFANAVPPQTLLMVRT